MFVWVSRDEMPVLVYRAEGFKRYSFWMPKWIWTSANSVDPDNELSHQDLHCLSFSSWFTTPSKHTTSLQRHCNGTTLQRRCNDVVATLSVCCDPFGSNGRVQIQRWKSLFQKLRVERVKHECKSLKVDTWATSAITHTFWYQIILYPIKCRSSLFDIQCYWELDIKVLQQRMNR